ncbi:TrbC/VirB2 family protein [Yersinia pestis]|nr:TrbC/VirB2 family protein [Yersinia pestis]MDL0603653.1 TrbC/VirB2 family protein [Yersinia pestis]MDL1129150.1 TrbC/VirB2 family protein [Yersinia pestis]
MFNKLKTTLFSRISKANMTKSIKSAFGALFVLAFASPVFAGGGLDAATSALTDVKTWLFTFVGVGALVYLLYCCAMAFMERKTWGEVGMALVYCCLAGGAVVGGTWALDLFQ